MISYTDAKGTPRRKKSADISIVLLATLRGSDPNVWRRLVFPDSLELGRLHDVLQVAFNWYDYQMHRFSIGDAFYGNPYQREGEPTIEDDRDIVFADLKLAPKSTFIYEYFMGDGWTLDLEIEKIIPAPSGLKNPYCEAGERASPPEDCGGPDGFKEILYSLAHPAEPISREWIEWLGDFDPSAFDVLETNKLIAKLMR